MTFTESVVGTSERRDIAVEPDAPPKVLADEGKSSSSDITFAAAFVAAVAAAFTGVQPTGTPWWDGFLAAALGVVVVVAGSRAHPFAVIATAAIAAAFAGSTPWIAVGLGGLALAMVAMAKPSLARALQPISAGFSYLALLHLGEVGFFASSALLAGIAIAILGISAYLRVHQSTQTAVRRAVYVLGLVLGVILVIAAYMAVSIRTSANAGVEAARNGLSSARAGDTQQISIELERAQLLLADADDRISSVWLQPLKLVPVAAQHQRSLSAATTQGLVVAEDAAALARDANLDDLQFRQGQFDLQLLAQMEPRLVSASASLQETVDMINADRSPWLLPPVDSQLQGLVDEIERVLPETRVAAEAAAVLPQMLGVDEERRYLILFGSPGESREFGGFVGGYSLISVVDGELDVLWVGSINGLVEFAARREAVLDAPGGYPQLFEQTDPALFPQNLTSSPNFSLIADAAHDVFPILEGQRVDGVIYADPYALAALTEFTGPLPIEGVAEPLDEQGVIDFIFEDQYRLFDSRDERFGAIGTLAAATADRIQGADLPGPERLGEVLGPAARAGRLQVVTFDDRENAFLASVRLQRNFSLPTEFDSVAVVQTNGSESKLDIYLHRSVRYEVSVDENGALSATVDVTLRSDIPADAPPLTLGETDGTNQVLLSLYSPHDLVDVSVNGAPHEHVTHEEFGFQRHALFRIPVAPNETANVRFSLTGVAPEGEYGLGVWSQPLVNNDEFEVIYNQNDGQTFTIAQELTENWLVRPALEGQSQG